MRVRWSWLAAAVLLLGYFVAMPDEGSAATKKSSGGGGSSISLNFTKIEFGLKVTDPTLPPPRDVADLNISLASANPGPAGSGGAILPTSSTNEVFDLDSFGVAHAASRDVLYTGAPGSFPSLSSYHFTLDFTAPGTTARGESDVMQVIHDPANPATLDKSYWQASVNVATPGHADYGYSLFVEANPDQPGLSIKSVQTAQAPNFSPIASSFFDVFVELNYDGVVPIDPSKPVVWLSTSAVPEPASVTLLAVLGTLTLRHRKR